MKPRKQIFKNQMSLIRRRRLLRQKQVARLLGHRTSEHISRYERGMRLPSLRSALKLAIIYDVPIRSMLNEYFEACTIEVRKQVNRMADCSSAAADAIPQTEYCSLEEKLGADRVLGSDLDKAYRHSTRLVRLRAEKLNHLSLKPGGGE